MVRGHGWCRIPRHWTRPGAIAKRNRKVVDTFAKSLETAAGPGIDDAIQLKSVGVLCVRQQIIDSKGGDTILLAVGQCFEKLWCIHFRSRLHGQTYRHWSGESGFDHSRI